ncbi:MAG TPA: AAA family ATPase [Sphingomonas sp.]|nr:AAA family ATPase [Sphingomonas sp.]
MLLRHNPMPPADDRVDGLRRAMAALRRRWMLACIMFVGVLGVVLMLGFSRTKLYTATANMVVNSRELNVSEKDKDVLPGLSTADNAADTEVQILRSSAVALGTVRALDLTHNPVFAPALAALPPAGREAATAAMMMGGLKVDRSGQSNVVSIAYTAPDPALARAVADQVGYQYLNVKERSRRAAVDQVDRGMGDQLGELRGQLEQAEAAVAQYKAQHGLLGTQGSTFTEQELSLYKQQEAASRAALAEASARVGTAEAQLNQGSNGGDVGAALQSPVVQQLRAQRAQLAATYADLQARYRPNHPDLIKAKDQLDEVDRAISAEIERQVSSLRANLQIARSQEANAAGTVAQTSGTLAAANAATVKLNELQRKADGLRDTYQTLLTRRNSISSQALVADEDARLFSPAAMPLKPVSPNKPLILLIGLGLATIIAAASVSLVEVFDRKLVTSDDVERKLGLPHIANVPEVGSLRRMGDARIQAIDYALERPASLYAESLRAIRLALLRPRLGGMATVGITSSRPNEGKTTMAISLARVSAMAGSRTLLIDSDVRRPMIAQALGLTPRAGLVELLRGQARLDDVLILDEASGAMLLPIVEAIGSSHDLFDAAHIQSLLAALERRFDLVIFDAAPALAVADARLLLRQLGDVLMVVRWKNTLRQTAAASLKRMRALDIEPLGVVTTRVDMRALAAYGHGDIDRDHAAYGTYYG